MLKGFKMRETGATTMLHLSERALDHFRMVLILATGYINNFQEAVSLWNCYPNQYGMSKVDVRALDSNHRDVSTLV